MAKILNLDDLSVAASRELVLGGKTYAIAEMTVDDFIETTRLADEIDGKPLSVQFQTTMGLIKRQIPEIELAALGKLSMEKLHAIAAFVRGVDPKVILESLAAVSAQATAPEAAAGNV